MNANNIIDLLQTSTIAVAFHASIEIMSYASGVITDKEYLCDVKSIDNEPDINHSGSIVGYSLNTATPGCSGFWIVKNSWGINWGEKGYAKFCIPIDRTADVVGTCGVQFLIMMPDVTTEYK
jgi:hypothetical protein